MKEIPVLQEYVPLTRDVEIACSRVVLSYR